MTWLYTNRIGFEFRADGLDQANRFTRAMMQAARDKALEMGIPKVVLDECRTDAHPSNFAPKKTDGPS